MVSLQELRDDVRSHVDEAVASFWSDQEVDRWVYEALRDVARRAEVLQAVASYTIQVDRLTYPAPLDMLRIYKVEFRLTSSHIVDLQFMPLRSLDDVTGISREVSGGIPVWWSYWGYPGGENSQVYLYPACSQLIPDGLRVYYYRLPARPTDPDGPVDIPAGWEDLVGLYAECNALRKARDPRYADALALYEARLEQMIAVTRQMTDQPTAWSASPWPRRWPWAGGDDW